MKKILIVYDSRTGRTMVTWIAPCFRNHFLMSSARPRFKWMKKIATNAVNVKITNVMEMVRDSDSAAAVSRISRIRGNSIIAPRAAARMARFNTRLRV